MIDYDPYGDDAMTDPRSLYARMVADAPLHPIPEHDAWAAVGFDAVWDICLDTKHFTCTRGQTPNQVLLGEPTGHTFPELDPPEHRLRRRVLADAYTREAAVRDAPMIRAIAVDVLEPLLDHGPVTIDAHRDYAARVTARVAARKAGLPDADAERIRHRMDDMFTRVPHQRGSSPENLAAIGDVFGYLMGVIAEARRDPGSASGLLPRLLDATVDGEALSDEQIAGELHTVMVTGSETTELAVAATLYHLAANPEQLAAVRADPALASHAFAEAIRVDHPTNVLCRAVGEDVEVAGVPMRAGQGVLLVWAAANRDPAYFEEPERYDLSRRPERDLLFGHGQHKCLGEHLAMQMGTILLQELLARVEEYEIDHDGVERTYGEFLKGFCRLPMRVVPR
ncbi:MAG: cytochrome P450 [Acidimicrobiia bacterium]